MKNDFCYNPSRINIGSIGLNKYSYSNQIISGAYVVFGTNENKLLPDYLNILIQHKNFYNYVKSKENKNTVRLNFSFEDISNWIIPLINIEDQIEMFHQFFVLQNEICNTKIKLTECNLNIKENIFKLFEEKCK